MTEPAGDRAFPIISLVGGKWTTFRGLAEEVADTILARLERRRATSTRTLAIGGGKAFPSAAGERARWLADAAKATGLAETRLDQLLARYGTTALAVAGHRGAFTDADRLPDSRDYSSAEMDWIARNEQVVHLTDIVMRRTTLAITDGPTARDLDAIAAVAGAALGWDPGRAAQEVASTTAELTGKHRSHLRRRPVRPRGAETDCADVSPKEEVAG